MEMYSHPNPSKLIFVAKCKFLSTKLNVFHFFFRFEISVTRSFRNRHSISHNTNSKILRQLCDFILPAKNVKTGKIKIKRFYKMMSSTLLQNSG